MGDLKKDVEKAINTARTNAKAVEFISNMKQNKMNDVEIIATGILISKIQKTQMDRVNK